MNTCNYLMFDSFAVFIVVFVTMITMTTTTTTTMMMILMMMIFLRCLSFALMKCFQVSSAVSRQFGTSTRLPQVGGIMVKVSVSCLMFCTQTVVLEMMILGLKVGCDEPFVRSSPTLLLILPFAAVFYAFPAARVASRCLPLPASSPSLQSPPPTHSRDHIFILQVFR
jgi:hypothetical protein